MLPRIKPELSLVNSLIELKDFKNLPHTLKKMYNLGSRLARHGVKIPVKRFKNSFGHVRETFDSSHGPTLRELSRGAADGYLEYSFNIAPTISDVLGLYHALDKAKRVSNNLLAHEGHRRLKKFKCPIDSVATDVNEPEFEFAALVDSNSYGDAYRVYGGNLLGMKVQTFNLQDSYRNHDAMFYAQMEYNYHFSAYQREHAEQLTLLDLLGVNLNPAVLWNAIPWSFAIDWVFQVGKYLNGRSVINMAPQINVTRYIWSWRCYRRARRYFYSYQTTPANCNAIIQTWLPDVFERAYRRSNDFGSLQSDPLIVDGLSNKEITLGLALLNNYSPRRKRA
jgi:hypothetical protein